MTPKKLDALSKNLLSRAFYMREVGHDDDAELDERVATTISALSAKLTEDEAALAQSRTETQAALAGCVSGEAVAYLHSRDDGSLELVLAQRVNSDTARRRIELGWKSTPLYSSSQPDTAKLAQLREALEHCLGSLTCGMDGVYDPFSRPADLARAAFALISVQEG